MPDLDPVKLADLIEGYLGKSFGGILIRLTLLMGLLGLIGLGSFWFFGTFVGGLVWPFFSSLFGVGASGITLDNIEPIVLTLVTTIVALVVVFACFLWAMWRVFRRRVVPQSVIDELAEFRSKAVSLYADHPTENEIGGWWAKQTDWSERVIVYMKEHLTKAETLSFQRLGVVFGTPFSHGVNRNHEHLLAILAHKLRVLENLIQRHQERQ